MRFFGLFLILVSVSAETSSPVWGDARVPVWTRAELHRKYIRDEGILDPEDWVFIFLIPRGAYFRTVARDPTDEVFLTQVKGSPLNHDNGLKIKNKQMIQFQIGGRLRFKVAMSGNALDYEKIEDRFWVEWSRFPK